MTGPNSQRPNDGSFGIAQIRGLRGSLHFPKSSCKPGDSELTWVYFPKAWYDEFDLEQLVVYQAGSLIEMLIVFSS